jgi:DNA-binding PadR family transcriptional regulator
MKQTGGNERGGDSLAPGSSYLEYCVRQGWLEKEGEGESATYKLTPIGEKKLADVSFNFDLSRLENTEIKPRRKYRRRR